MTTRRTLTAAALALFAASALAGRAEAGHRGRTYVYNGSTGYYTGGCSSCGATYAAQPTYAQPVYAQTYAQPMVYTQAYAAPVSYYTPTQPAYPAYYPAQMTGNYNVAPYAVPSLYRRR